MPGLIAYIDGQPAGWCSIGPRGRSLTLKRIDDEQVWSVVRFFVARPHRGPGAKAIEGYPWPPSQDRRPSGTEAFVWLAQALSAAGFSEAAHVSDQRLVMRYAGGEG